MSRKKVIVTGGTGYIGSHTSVELLQADFDVVIIDNLSNSTAEVVDRIAAIANRRPQFEQIDIRYKKELLDFFRRHADASAVIHFAALKAVGESVEKPLVYYENNISGLVNVLSGMHQNNIGNFIFSSSATVYGQPDVLPATEQTAIQPAISPYGNSKQIGEEIILDLVSSNPEQMEAISLRYFNPIGAHPSAGLGELPIGVPNNLMPFITQTAAGVRESLRVFGSDYNTVDGTAVRDYIHVVDLAQAHVVALNRLVNGENETSFELFNLGTGRGFSVLEVIQSFERTTGLKLNYEIVARRAGDAEQIFADTSLAAEKLGWRTKYSLDDMTRTAWAWEKLLRNLD